MRNVPAHFMAPVFAELIQKWQRASHVTKYVGLLLGMGQVSICKCSEDGRISNSITQGA